MVLALTIYFYGPRAYTFLKTILQLPSPRTLRRITKRIQVVPAMDYKINNLKNDAKECIL
ncbi:THAP domain-containing protein 9 [Aphis craccivora]|uniref:THAP domain-containing protein 9 n=1 Tax=Aphis craccivora TaxID=307492 RepID=A0A6G0VMV8_APHCR|nr:THAP domain-containing protein 9 [Aphis craccivora]